MKKYNLEDFTRGWVVGNFAPSIIKTKDFEVMVRHYKPGDFEEKHVHKIANEITIVISGKFKMDGEVLQAGDIIHLLPGNPSDFECLEDGATTVIKTPSVIGDKFLIN